MPRLPETASLCVVVFIIPVMKLNASQVYVPLSVTLAFSIVRTAWLKFISVPLSFHENILEGTESAEHFNSAGSSNVTAFFPLTFTLSGPSEGHQRDWLS